MELVVNHLNMDEDEKILAVCLEAVRNILGLGAKSSNLRGENSFLSLFDSLGGTRKVEDLQNHKSDEVHENALSILEEYYDLEDA